MWQRWALVNTDNSRSHSHKPKVHICVRPLRVPAALINAENGTLSESGQAVLYRFKGLWEEVVPAPAIKGLSYHLNLWMEAIIRKVTFGLLGLH